MSTTPTDDFFAQFVELGFRYKGNRPAFNNFKRLCNFFQWDEQSQEFSAARGRFYDALVQQFKVTFGEGGGLEAWQKLCTVIDITPTPLSVAECQKCIQAVHVNIVDLIEAGRTGKRVRKFATLKELRTYTLNTEKIFPKEKARIKSLLRDLLRMIGKGGRRKKRRGRKRAAPAQPSS